MKDKTINLLEKALQTSPNDWETRAFLVDAYLSQNEPLTAKQFFDDAPSIPDAEDAMLLKARVELANDEPTVIATLQTILEKNRACAQAYLLFAKVYQRRGLQDEARKKYGAATVIDESISDPALETWLALPSSSRPTLIANHEEVAPDESEGLPEAEDSSLALVSPEETAQALAALGEFDAPKIGFSDIGGMHEIIEQIRMNIIYPFKNPDVFKKFKKKPGGGILMYGPPGCGKTHLARATAGECGATFISIAITDILSKWLGESERRLHELFETARRRSPVVIFIDEIDAIGVSRNEASSLVASIVNVLLTEMDGIASGNENVMVLAATNTPWRVDSALRRPGRFDRVLFVPPPDDEARRAIFEICLRDLPTDAIDVAKLAKLTEHCSGADIRGIVERAAEKAIYEEMRTGRESKLTQKQLIETIKEHRPSTAEWLETARSYATYSNRSGIYDDLVQYFEKH